MAVVAQVVTVSGSPAMPVLTDLRPGLQRPFNQPLAGTLPAWLIPAAIGLVSGAIWGRSSKPNEDLAQLQSDKIEAAIMLDEAKASKVEQESRAIADAIDNPKGISPELAEEIARRRIGVEESTAELARKKYEDEGEFRDTQRAAQRELIEKRRAETEFEADVRSASFGQLLDLGALAATRARLENQKLELSNQLVGDFIAGRTVAPTPGAAAPSQVYVSPPVTEVKEIGPGVRGGIRIGLLPS